MPKGKKTILLVDNHPIIVVAVKSLLEVKRPDYRLLDTSTRSGALKVIEAEKPEIAIIDLVLPDGDGLELIRDILGKSPECKILVFSMQCEIRYGPSALRNGAKGYLMKGEKVAALFDALRHIDEGKTYCSDALREALVNRWRGREKECQITTTLSTREFQIFKMLGQGHTSKEIASTLFVSPKTVESHRENIKRKLSCKTSTELVLKARDWLNLETESVPKSRVNGNK